MFSSCPRNRAVSCLAPAVMSDLAKCGGSIAIHHSLYIVCWGIWLGLSSPSFFLGPMLRRVPSPACNVHAAGECQSVIYRYDLLMMAPAGRMVVIELKVDSWMPKRISATHQFGIPRMSEE